MANILHRWFGLGSLPAAMRPVLEAEGILLLDEGVSGSIGFRNFRAPGKYHGRRRSGVVASLVVTRLRFAVFQYSNPFVNLPLERSKLDLLELGSDARNRLTIGFDAADFYPDATGAVTGRFATARWRAFLDHLRAV